MAGRTISTRITLDGEKEFRQSMSEVNSGLKAMSSALALTEAQYASQSNSVDALRAKQQALAQQYELQSQKVQLLRQRLQESATATGENSVSTNRLRDEYNRAQIALIRMGEAVEENSSQLEAAEGGADGLTNSLGNLADAADEAAGGAENFGSSASEAFFQAGAALANAEIIDRLTDIAKKLLEATTAAASFADEVITLSVQTGVSAENIQAMMYASQLLDVSVSDISGSMAKVSRAMSSAQGGSDSASAAFERLGISVEDSNGHLRDSEDVFWEAIDALGGIANETERDAVAMELFGKSARTLNPIIKQGSQAFRDLKQEAASTGYILSGQTLQSLGALDDQMQRLSNAADAAKNAFGAAMAPALTALAEALTTALNAVTKFIDENRELVSIAGAAVGTVAAVAAGIMTVQKVATLARSALSLMNGALGGAAIAAGPLLIAAAALGVTLEGVANNMEYLNSVGTIDLETSSVTEAAENLAYWNEQLERFNREHQNMEAAEWNSGDYLRLDQLEAAVQHATEAYDELVAREEEAKEAADASAELERTQQAIADTKTVLDAYTEAYERNYAAATKAISGTMGLFNDLTGELGFNTEEILSKWDSQTEAVENYTANLQQLKDLGVDESLIGEISDGSLQSMQTAAQLMQDLTDVESGVDVNAVNAAWEARAQAVDAYATYLTEKAPEVQSAMDKLVAVAKTGADDLNLREEMKESAQNTIDGYLEKLDGGPIAARMAEIAHAALEAFNGALGVASPSRRMMESARWTVLGFTEGIRQNEHEVRDSMSGLADTAYNAFDLPDLSSGIAGAGAAGGGNVVNLTVYAQEMTEAQTDYLIRQVNERILHT